MAVVFQKTNPYTTPQTYHLKREDFFALIEPFTLSGNIVDVESQEIYKGRLHIIEGRIQRIERCHVPESCYILPGFVNASFCMGNKLRQSSTEDDNASLPHTYDDKERIEVMLAQGTLAAISSHPLDAGFKFFFQPVGQEMPVRPIDVCEAEEQIGLGRMILIDEANFYPLYPLINQYPSSVVFAINESQQAKSELFSILDLFKLGLAKELNFFNLLKSASRNAIDYFNLPLGKLRENDTADCVLVDNLTELRVLQVFIDGFLRYEAS